MIRSLFRSLEVSLHERLTMIEDVIRISKTREAVAEQEDAESVQPTDIIVEKLTAIEDCLNSLAARVTAIESAANAAAAAAPKETVHVNRLAQSSSEQLYIHPMKGVEIILKEEVPPRARSEATAVVPAVVEAVPVVPALPPSAPVVKPAAAKPAPEAEEEEENAVEDVAEEEEGGGDGDGDGEAEEEEVAEEEENAEEEVAEEEEEGLELEEFEYKGKTYYKDGENRVYGQDEEGEPSVETPIGTWDESRQRVLFRRQ